MTAINYGADYLDPSELLERLEETKLWTIKAYLNQKI